MEFNLRPLGFKEFLQNDNHQAVNKMKTFPWHYINLIYIHLLLLYYTIALS